MNNFEKATKELNKKTQDFIYKYESPGEGYHAKFRIYYMDKCICSTYDVSLKDPVKVIKEMVITNLEQQIESINETLDLIRKRKDH